MAAKTLGESKRGKQHQSMEPSVPTSAAEFISPIRPYWSIGLYTGDTHSSLAWAESGIGPCFRPQTVKPHSMASLTRPSVNLLGRKYLSKWSFYASTQPVPAFKRRLCSNTRLSRCVGREPGATAARARLRPHIGSAVVKRMVSWVENIADGDYFGRKASALRV